jgi:putative aminopeptidase FrvX
VVTYADEKGFLRFSAVGGQPEAYLLGKRVLFDNGTVGVIGIEKQEHEKKPTTDRMFIDIGAPGREEALRMTGIGRMCAVFSPPAAGERTITGGWVDERIGCFVLLEAMELLRDNPHDLFFVFSAQGEVGMRGAQTSTYRLEPDIGISVDATVCSDLPEGELTGSCVLGGGAGIKVMDTSVIVPRGLVDRLISLARKRGIPHQRDIATGVKTGVQAIQLSRSGVLAGGISVPVRYARTAGAMCALYDVKACVDLTVAFCEEKYRL